MANVNYVDGLIDVCRATALDNRIDHAALINKVLSNNPYLDVGIVQMKNTRKYSLLIKSNNNTVLHKIKGAQGFETSTIQCKTHQILN